MEIFNCLSNLVLYPLYSTTLFTRVYPTGLFKPHSVSILHPHFDNLEPLTLSLALTTPLPALFVALLRQYGPMARASTIQDHDGASTLRVPVRPPGVEKLESDPCCMTFNMNKSQNLHTTNVLNLMADFSCFNCSWKPSTAFQTWFATTLGLDLLLPVVRRVSRTSALSSPAISTTRQDRSTYSVQALEPSGVLFCCRLLNWDGIFILWQAMTGFI